jgi:hypothetical protein
VGRITVTLSPNNALADLPLVDRALMHEVFLLARERILRRTASGQDVEGQPFKEYSEGYAKVRADNNLSTSVNLTVSGNMLGSITEDELTDTSVTLVFSN